MSMGTEKRQKSVVIESSGGLDKIRKWLVLATASILIFGAYLMQYQVSALAFLLIPQYSLSAVELSNLILIPMALAAVIGIPLGAAADRFGTRKVVGACIAVALVGAILRVVATSYTALLAAMLLIGFAPAAMNSNLMRLLGAWFKDRASFALGIYYACSGLGAFVALASSALIGSTRGAFALSALLLVVACCLWFALVADSPAGEPIPRQGNMRASLGVAARCSTVWVIALITGLSLAAKTAYLSFLPQVLGATLGASHANLMASAVSVGGIVGCAAGPVIWSLFKRVKPAMVVITAVSGILMALSVSALSPNVAVFFIVGCLASVMGPLVEAIPCHIPAIAGSVGSAGGIIGSVSLAVTYLIPLAISALSGDSYVFISIAMAACFIAAIPLIISLPGVRAEDYAERAGD